jgi:hypothetical protein
MSWVSSAGASAGSGILAAAVPFVWSHDLIRKARNFDQLTATSKEQVMIVSPQGISASDRAVVLPVVHRQGASPVSRPVRIIVGFPPGGRPTSWRVIAQWLSTV